MHSTRIISQYNWRRTQTLPVCAPRIEINVISNITLIVSVLLDIHWDTKVALDYALIHVAFCSRTQSGVWIAHPHLDMMEEKHYAWSKGRDNCDSACLGSLCAAGTSPRSSLSVSTFSLQMLMREMTKLSTGIETFIGSMQWLFVWFLCEQGIPLLPARVPAHSKLH